MAIKGAVYNLLIRKVSRAHYGHLLDVLPDGAHVLDVGVGNGVMLDRFAERIRAKGVRIEGIDIDADYLRECARRIAEHDLGDLVSCRKEDVVRYLDSAEQTPPFVYFSTSFMLLPDQDTVLSLLARKLPAGGRALFAQTLLEEPNKLVEWVKPKLKYVTSVDFGRAQYRADFLARMTRHGFALDSERRFERVSGNKHIYFHEFRVEGIA